MVFNLFHSSSQKKQKKYYLGLLLQANEGNALILEFDHTQKTVRKVDEKKFICSDSWDHLAENIDEALFQLERDNNCSIKEVIFFLYAHFVDQNTKKIKKPYLPRIEEVTKELTLQPLGYIDYHEALSIYLSEKEKHALTAVVVEIDASLISLFIYKGGALVLCDSFQRGDVELGEVNQTSKIVSDLELLFAKMKDKTVFPSRILIYDSSKLEDELSSVITHQWSEALFVQIPKFEIVAEDELEKALLFSFSQQLFDERKESATDAKPQEILGFSIEEDIQTKVEPLPQKQEEKKVTHYARSFFTMMRGRSRILIVFLALVVFLSSLFFTFLYFFHHASVTVYLQGKTIEKQLEVIGFFGGAENKDALKIEKTEQTIEKENSVHTSGKKTVGEKARGEVTIYNSAKAEKVFKKNTIFTTSSGVRFTSDDEIKVASASESLTTEGNVLTVTGKSRAALTASDIGNEGNIDKNEKLKIEDFPLTLYFAIPTNVFSGGAKRDIKTVSKDDLNKLKDAVVVQMKEEEDVVAKTKIASSKIIDALTKVDITEEHYSKELGEEAKDLSLSAKGVVTLFAYHEEAMKEILARRAGDFIPKEYELPEKNISYTITGAQKEDKKITLATTITAQMMMKLDKKKLLQAIAGKNTHEIEKMLKEKYTIQKHKIEVDSFLPFLRSYAPFFEKNITMRVESL